MMTGRPTKEELVAHYPPRFTWAQLKTFIDSGVDRDVPSDLGLLKRDIQLQKRYDACNEQIKAEYGTVNYLMNCRLQWGKQDSMSILQSGWKWEVDDEEPDSLLSPQVPKYFTSDIPSRFVSIILNDWPYSVPLDVEHLLIWTRAPIFHEELIAPSIAKRIEQDGLWGFTGLVSPPPSPSSLPSALPALSDWGVTMEKLIRSERGSPDEEVLVRRAGEHVERYIKKWWDEAEWETAWFVNPPRLQSVLGLAHIHVFARKKL